MAFVIYSLCAVTSLVCTVLLLRSHRQTKSGLLLWSGLCFAGLTLNNVLLVLDRVMFPEVDMLTARLVVGFVALLLIVFGLVWESE